MGWKSWGSISNSSKRFIRSPNHPNSLLGPHSLQWIPRVKRPASETDHSYEGLKLYLHSPPHMSPWHAQGQLYLSLSALQVVLKQIFGLVCIFMVWCLFKHNTFQIVWLTEEPLKCQYTSTKLHGVTLQNTAIYLLQSLVSAFPHVHVVQLVF